MQTPKEEHFQGPPPADRLVTDNLRHRLRLFPSHTAIVLKHILANTIDYEYWYPSYNYPSTFDIANTYPTLDDIKSDDIKFPQHAEQLL